MSTLVEIDLASAIGGTGPAQARDLSDADIAARCLPASKRGRYVDAIQAWEDKIDP